MYVGGGGWGACVCVCVLTEDLNLPRTDLFSWLHLADVVLVDLRVSENWFVYMKDMTATARGRGHAEKELLATVCS